MALSRSQIDRLGERLKSGSPSEADQKLLDEYRSELLQAYQQVRLLIREQLGLKITGRERKTTQSIIEKLRRESTLNLSQMQDIAGCRIVVENVVRQDDVAERIRDLFTRSARQVKVIDRRSSPSHGYRAIHVVVRVDRLPIEVQVRTELQDRWANVSEKLADEFRDQSIKYGGGPEEVRALLTRLSNSVEALDAHKRELIEEFQRLAILAALGRDAPRETTIDAFAERAKDWARRADQLRKEFDAVTQLLRLRREHRH